MPAPAVSVIITCYNQGRFLGDAIESVLAQDFRDFEILVVDDGSTDDTPKVSSKHPDVIYIRQANAGLSSARNAGLVRSRGRFVVFLDADDLLLPDALRSGIDCFESHPDSAFVFGGHRGIGVDGSFLWERLPEIDQEQDLAFLRGNHIAMHGTVMYRRDILEAAGGFDTSLSRCEDYDMYLRIVRKHPVACHRNVVAAYRQHDANMSRDAAGMLVMALSVLRSQRARIGGDRRRMRAYRQGLIFWQHYYGYELLRQVARDLRARGRRRQAARGLSIALRHAPRAFPLAAGELFRRAARKLARALPPTIRRALRRAMSSTTPPLGCVRLGDLRRLSPIDPDFGFGRGLPVDRHYIEGFLARHAGDIRGRVLEIGDNAYTRRFGGEKVARSDVLHVAEGNPNATIVGDLAKADHIPSDAFDCVILTQTLHLVYDVRAALATLERILKPGGVLLATVPGISQIDRGEWRHTWYWSFTSHSARRMFGEAFGSGVAVETYGNVLAAVAFLHGLAAEELKRRELDEHDPSYQVIIAVRAVKAQAAA